MTKGELNLYHVYKSTETGVYFLQFYESMRARFLGKKVDPSVVNFKKYGSNLKRYSVLIKCIRDMLNLSTSVACPGHKEELNNIQIACDSEVVLLPKHERLQKHNDKEKDFEEQERNRLEIYTNRNYDGKPVLLCDDVYNTGETMRTITSILQQNEIEVKEYLALAHSETEYQVVATILLEELKRKIKVLEVKSAILAKPPEPPSRAWLNKDKQEKETKKKPNPRQQNTDITDDLSLDDINFHI